MKQVGNGAMLLKKNVHKRSWQWCNYKQKTRNPSSIYVDIHNPHKITWGYVSVNEKNLHDL
jgi:hypothetical protein